jgi:hypothetical protein
MMKSHKLRLFRILLVAAAVALAAFRFPAPRVETLYSNGFYPRMAEVIKPLTRCLPIPALDLLVITLAIGLPLWWIWRLRAAGAGRRWLAVIRAAIDTLTLAAAMFCAFELLWGLNYQRLPLTAKLDWDEKRATPHAALALARSSIENLNTEAAAVQEHPLPPPEQWRAALHQSFQLLLNDLGQRRAFSAVPPRTSMLNPYFSAASIDGFANPFGYEVILNSDVLPFERPYLLAHEWAHVAGFADESEATFIGLLACLRSDLPAVRYSGWLELHLRLPQRNPKTAEVWPELAPAVIRDIHALRARAQKHRNVFLVRAHWRLYNRFLKAQRVAAGTASYGLGTKLILGARFEGHWSPVPKALPAASSPLPGGAPDQTSFQNSGVGALLGISLFACLSGRDGENFASFYGR